MAPLLIGFFIGNDLIGNHESDINCKIPHFFYRGEAALSNEILIAPCHFGMEAVLKREITDLGYEIDEVDNGKVTFIGDENAIARANINLRTTERILWRIGRFHAETFEELFQAVKAIAWDFYIPFDGRFWVAKANSVNSKLFSPRDIQRIVKKAIVEELKEHYPGIEIFPETGADYPIRISILKNEVTICLDTTGESLHKRGYRKFTAPAPLTETLAAAILLLSPWKADRVLVDPFCGSGTIPIEAALIARRMAPGLHRSFLSEAWADPREDSESKAIQNGLSMLLSHCMATRRSFAQAREDAEQAVIREPMELSIAGYDIDDEVLRMARENARLAGVDGDIHFQRRDIADFSSPKKYGFVITNPPYGERLNSDEEKKVRSLYRTIGEKISADDTWSWFVLSGYEETENAIRKKATKNRKIYNGMLKTYLYQYMGVKPPKRPKQA
ncbi:MAG: class I SAM-dependent RNA methyltransferase [Eubacterium sp.]|nr:class I SAM-dependent RNA methyltransferase [Eubacterium sp.]